MRCIADALPPADLAKAAVPSGQIPPYTGSAAPQQAPNLTMIEMKNPNATPVAANSTVPDMSAPPPDLATPPLSDLPQLASPPETVAEAPQIPSPPPPALKGFPPPLIPVTPPPSEPLSVESIHEKISLQVAFM